MLWIGIWVHPCTVTLLVNLTQIWVMWGWWGETMTHWRSWGCTTPLSLPPHLHILYMESVWACSYAVDRHMGAPLHCYTAGHQVEPDLGNLGIVGRNNGALTWLRLYNSTHFYFTSIIYIWKVFEHVHMPWIGIWVHPCTVTLLAIKLNQIRVMWGWWGKQRCVGIVESVQLHSLYLHICIVYIESVWACSYAVDRHMGAPLHCYTAGHQVDPDLGNVGMVGWNNDLLTWLRLYNSTHFISASVLYT
jgi:hypothetical protein